jgi:hypothetical protein
MASGKNPSEEKKPEQEAPPEKKPESEGDPLAALIDNYSEEVEPVRPGEDAGKGEQG